MSTNHSKASRDNCALLLSSFDMQNLGIFAKHGIRALKDNPVAESTLRHLTLSLCDNWEDGLPHEPLPLQLTLTTLYPITGG